MRIKQKRSLLSDNALKCLIAASLAAFAASWWNAESLPGPAQILPDMLPDPLQSAVQKPVFDVQAGGITYHIKPLYRYELNGVVVSKHNADSWWDYFHREANDRLNVTDLCVAWGDNIQSGLYRDLSYHNGQFTCNWHTSSDSVYAGFDPTEISNNHLLSNDPSYVKTLKNIRVGDQIRITGMLSEYSHEHGFNFHRGTSTVRTDSGNGACETIFVDSVEIVRSGNQFWRFMYWISLAGLLIGILGWFTAPPRLAEAEH